MKISPVCGQARSGWVSFGGQGLVWVWYGRQKGSGAITVVAPEGQDRMNAAGPRADHKLEREVIRAGKEVAP